MVANLRKLRESAGVSQKTLAEAVGVSQQSINRYENHSVEPDIDMLIRFADYFHTSVDYLVGHAGIAHKIERVRTYELNEEEGRLLEGFRALNRKQRQSIGLVIDNYLELKK